MSARAYFDVLVRHETALWNAVEKRLRSEGVLSLARIQVLDVVSASPGGARMNDIADAVGTTIGAASRLIDRLATDGIVDRTVDPDDRRGVRVSLTLAGTEALRQATAHFDVVLGEVLVRVDPAALTAGAEVLSRVQSAIEGDPRAR